MTLKRRKAIAVVLVFVMLLTSFCWTTEKADAAAGNDIANLAIQIANGPKIPYVSGGRSLRGFDCCGFVWYVCNQLGVNVGTGNQRSQINYGTAVDYSLLKSNGNVSALQPGDLVFFDYTGGGSDHVGIYVGNGQMAHTSSSRSDVIIVSLSGQCGYGPWYSVVCGVRRVANGGSTPAVCTHTYWKGSEAAHPHKEFYKCSKCGYYYYTGVNFAGQISSCSTCQAMKPAVCNHSYTTEYEAAHPHKEYKRCTKCGYTEYTGTYKAKVSKCATCYPQKSFKITIDPTGGTIIKGKDAYEFNGEGVVYFNQLEVKKQGYKLVGWQVYFKTVDKWYTQNGFKTKTQMAEKGIEIAIFDPSSKITLLSNGHWEGEMNISLVVYAVWEEDPSAEYECNHEYKIDYSIVHPHKEYKMCLKCGDVEFTEKTKTFEDCKQCNPTEKEECQHTYKKKYETSHPHEIYYQCSKCGDKYGTAEYTEFDDCDQCLEEESIVTAVQISGKAYDGYIKLSWSGQEAIAEYVIYRSTDGKNYEEYDDTFGTYYVDRNVKSGSTYYYYVIVEGEINTSEKSNIFKVELSSQSKTEKIRTGIENTQIKNLKAKKTGSKVKLTWKKSTSKYKVDGYFVLRSTKKNATYKKIKETTVRSCTVTKPKKGKTYYYMVFGYRIVDGEMINTIPATIAVKG